MWGWKERKNQEEENTEQETIGRLCSLITVTV